MRILVYDSSTQIREGFIMALMPHGFEVVTIKEKNEILPIFSKRPFDIAIIEASEEDPDIMKIIRTLQTDERYNGVSVIVHVLEPTKLFIVEMMKIGIAGYLLKPFNEKDLLNRLKSILEKAHININNLKPVVVKPRRDENLIMTFRSLESRKVISTKVIEISPAGVKFELPSDFTDKDIQIRNFINNLQIQIGAYRVVTGALITEKREKEYFAQFHKIPLFDLHIICKYVYDRNIEEIMNDK